MSPILFGVALVFTVVPMALSQCTNSRCADRGYEPPSWENGALYLETLLSETSKTLLKAVETQLAGQSEAIETRLTAQSQATEKLAKAFDNRFASFEKAINTRMEAFQASQENGTTDIASDIERLADQSSVIATHSAEQSETIKELAKAIDDRFASLKEALNTRMDTIEEKSTALETRLAQQEGSLKAHLTRTIDEKYNTLTETLEGLAEQSMAVEGRLSQLEGVIKTMAIVGRCENLTETLEEVTDRLNRRVDDLQERVVTQMRKLGNIMAERLTNETQMALAVTEDGLKDSSAPSNITVSDLMHSTESSVISDSEETREPTTETYTTLGAQISEFLPGQLIVFLRRMDGSVNFTRPWADYKGGFGDRGAEFWLGLDTLHALTTRRQYKLRVELTDWSGDRKWEVYNQFSVGSEKENYRLNVSGYDRSVSTTKGVILQTYSNGKQFSTIDAYINNCAMKLKGGWWYEDCVPLTNPTGVYRPAGFTGYRVGDGGIQWFGAYNDYRPFKELTLKLIPV